MEHVNHPAHYQRKDGIECIDIIRHYVCDIANALKYLMRAGKKQEMGMEDAEKEIEDLKKALWYIEDYQNSHCYHHVAEVKPKLIDNYIHDITGHTVAEITTGYTDKISLAIFMLLQMGLNVNGGVYNVYGWPQMLDDCKTCIQGRIVEVGRSLLDKEIKETVDVLHGKAVDGEDYVSKPGCVRETEPEKYDPLNMIVAWGRVYSLTDEVRKKPNGALYSPCDNCDLIEVCYDDWRRPDTSVCHDLCRLHQAKTNEYYREVGVAKYAPSSGTVEVVDEMKEMELELRELERAEEGEYSSAERERSRSKGQMKRLEEEEN